MLSHDARLRCDMVDLYYALYGTKRPQCLPTAELSAMFKPQRIAPPQLIPSADIKKRADSPIDEKPVRFDDEPILADQIIDVDDDVMMAATNTTTTTTNANSADNIMAINFDDAALTDEIKLEPKQTNVDAFQSEGDVIKIEPEMVKDIKVVATAISNSI